MASKPDQRVLIPIKLDAFVFNKKVCDGGESTKDWENRAKIAPITQPNYTFLRLGKANKKTNSDQGDDEEVGGTNEGDDQYLQADILNDVDLHRAWPAYKNSRFTDLGTGKPYRHRQGIYLHWTIPRVYRSGTPVDDPAHGLPKFPEVPTRWLVVRHITDMTKVEPAEARKELKPVTAWVIESDRKWDLEGELEGGRVKDPYNLLPKEYDIQVDVSPFISATTEDRNPEQQAEVFIGSKELATSWTERGEAKSRVQLQLLGSSNELFADYQPHCSNVFSMIDNFEYKPGQYATEVCASYSVIGWHSPDKQDLLKPEKDNPKRVDRLKDLSMAIKGYSGLETYPATISHWLDLPSREARSLCHGAMYEVKWNVEEAPTNIQADHYAAALTGVLPIAVGTTPMDALMTYIGSHVKPPKPDGKDEQDNDDDRKYVEKKLWELEKYLLARDDGVEAQMQAADMLYNWNYLRLDGGDYFHVAASTDGGKPTVPDDQLKDLAELNKWCRLRDALERKTKSNRWNIFSEWWKALTKAKDNEEIAIEVKKLSDGIDAMTDQLHKCEEEIRRLKDKYKDKDTGEFQAGVHSPFYQQRDPTLLVGGIKSGWEVDYLNTLQVRLDCQVYQDGVNPLPGEEQWSELFDLVEKKMPEGVRDSVKPLLREFVLLRNKRDAQKKNTPVEDKVIKKVSGEKPEPPAVPPEMPVFHDMEGRDKDWNPVWRDLWNDTQPWFPLYLEWEVEYTHLDHEKYWELAETSRWQEEAPRLHYSVKADLDVEEEYKRETVHDTQQLSGRVLMLPQASFSLRDKLAQFFSDTPLDDLNEIIDQPDREQLMEKLYKLEFLSAPLSGFANHMLTVEQGNHIKPNIRDPENGKLFPFEDAARDEAGLTKGVIGKIDIESDLTPYGKSRPAPGKGNPAVFKPVTHGQFRITRLNIIDKFGQAIHAIDPTPSQHPPKIFPCISDWYAPEGRPGNNDHANVIVPDANPKQCEFVQVPHQINQPARLNMAFVMPTETQSANRPRSESSFWQPVNEWDQPIWGWVVINYANYGLQFFLPDGAFYREVRRAGAKAVQDSPRWLPFQKPDQPGSIKDPAARQLARLVEQLAGDQQYLKEFIDTMQRAIEKQNPSPSSYAEFRNALIGQPLALVYVGMSLELAGPPWKSHLSEDAELSKSLVTEEKDKKQYNFPIKLGDGTRGYDGLVGYFVQKDEGPVSGDALNLAKMYSHFGPGSDISRITPINKSNYPKLNAHFIDPEKCDPDSYTTEINKTLTVIGMLVSPFLACHAYSGILPIKELSLPNWTWQSSLDRLSAFFHMGPVLVTGKIPEFDKDRQLEAGKQVPKVVDKPKGENAVALPGGTMEQWTWLQPYTKDSSESESDMESEGSEPVERYMPIATELADEKAKLQPGPYLALEGYLQMASAPEVKK